MTIESNFTSRDFAQYLEQAMKKLSTERAQF